MKFSEQNGMTPAALSAEDPNWREEIGLLHLYEIGEADLARPQYDSRKVQSGDAFFAIRGFATDGHRFIGQAIASGAKTIVLEDADAFSVKDAKQAGVSRLVVKNSPSGFPVV